MVRLVYLDEDDDRIVPMGHGKHADITVHDAVDNLNAFSAALMCYPIASQLASYVDLNTLNELSRTCRRFRSNLLQYRSQLIAQSLRCENDQLHNNESSNTILQTRQRIRTTHGPNGVRILPLTSGRHGACARDKVGPCMNCSRVICRNCVVKSPPTNTLKGRHRRLCRTCLKAPLADLTTITTPSSITENGFDSDADSAVHIEDTKATRSPCTCAAEVWLCSTCGYSLRPADTTYMRGWTWRTRYSACGGIGAGLGEGNEGVECGRTRDCLAARIVEKDVECDADELAAMEAEIAKAEFEGRHWDGSSYSTQEIVGIGGKVKKKVRKRVRVGAIVKEYEDERVTEKVLEREQKGENRSWCAWCDRVIVGQREGAITSSPSL